MAIYSDRSLKNLETCHADLQRIFYEVINVHDCTIIEGHRSPQRQLELYNGGKSKVVSSKHNYMPSLAIDVAPYLKGRGVPWPVYGKKDYIKDLNQFYYFSGIVMCKANDLGINVRWGGDWDKDHYFADQTFDDLVHFELVRS